jgi:two-component system, OmpR family, phosphate regulon sensor histidine kinase PhoR
MQDELKKYANTLEEKVTQRTAEIEKMLVKVEEANKNKTQFVSDVSHELRTPLASIKGYVSTIRSDKEMSDATRAEFLGIVEDETDRLARIIDQLLDISRIEAGRLKLNPRSFQLSDLVHRNIANMKEQAKKKQVTIEEELSQEPLYVYADQDKTAQIIINLLSNAVKYNKPGGTVKVSATKGDDGKVRVEVKDTGYGISEKDLPHMFEKFYRVERTSNEAPGTGLGLAVTKNLLEVMGGNIELESRYGEGSTFSFTLPKGAGN